MRFRKINALGQILCASKKNDGSFDGVSLWRRSSNRRPLAPPRRVGRAQKARSNDPCCGVVRCGDASEHDRAGHLCSPPRSSARCGSLRALWVQHPLWPVLPFKSAWSLQTARWCAWTRTCVMRARQTPRMTTLGETAFLLRFMPLVTASPTRDSLSRWDFDWTCKLACTRLAVHKQRTARCHSTGQRCTRVHLDFHSDYFFIRPIEMPDLNVTTSKESTIARVDQWRVQCCFT